MLLSVLTLVSLFACVASAPLTHRTIEYVRRDDLSLVGSLDVGEWYSELYPRTKNGRNKGKASQVDSDGDSDADRKAKRLKERTTRKNQKNEYEILLARQRKGEKLTLAEKNKIAAYENELKKKCVYQRDYQARKRTEYAALSARQRSGEDLTPDEKEKIAAYETAVAKRRVRQKAYQVGVRERGKQIQAQVSSSVAGPSSGFPSTGQSNANQQPGPSPTPDIDASSSDTSSSAGDHSGPSGLTLPSFSKGFPWLSKGNSVINDAHQQPGSLPHIHEVFPNLKDLPPRRS